MSADEHAREEERGLDQGAIERLLFVEGLSVKEVASIVGTTSMRLRKWLQRWGLEGELRQRGLRSHPQVQLMRVVRKLYPNAEIKSEYPVGDRLALDLYLPRYRLGFEYDGRQHHQFVEFFHRDQEGFERSQERDAEKDRLCHALGILLVRIKEGENIDPATVMQKIKQALASREDEPEAELPYHERLRRRSRDVRRARMRAAYQLAKQRKKQGN